MSILNLVGTTKHFYTLGRKIKIFHIIMLLEIKTKKIRERVVFVERENYDPDLSISPYLNEKVTL